MEKNAEKAPDRKQPDETKCAAAGSGNGNREFSRWRFQPEDYKVIRHEPVTPEEEKEADALLASILKGRRAVRDNDLKDRCCGILDTLRRESEDLLNGLQPKGKKVTLGMMIEYERGILVTEFRTGGEGLVLKSGEVAQRRHAFARLLYDVSDSSCTVKICPAIIPVIDPSRYVLGSDAGIEKKMESWRFVFGDVLHRAGVRQVEIGFGNLLELPYPPHSWQCHDPQ